MIIILEANTTCRNLNCNKGYDGKRRKYYSCKFCARTENWKSVACSIECLNEYQEQIKARRAKNKSISLAPERIDMTESQHQILMQTPLEQVKEESIREITEAGYGEDLKELGLSKTLEKINKDICDAESEPLTIEEVHTNRRKRNTKSST